MNTARSDNGTALYIASEKNHLHVVRYLVEQGADKEKADNDGATPLMAAAFNGHAAVVRLLQQSFSSQETREEW